MQLRPETAAGFLCKWLKRADDTIWICELKRHQFCVGKVMLVMNCCYLCCGTQRWWIWAGVMDGNECLDANPLVADEESLIEGVSDAVLLVLVLSVTFLAGLVTLLCRWETHSLQNRRHYTVVLNEWFTLNWKFSYRLIPSLNDKRCHFSSCTYSESCSKLHVGPFIITLS